MKKLYTAHGMQVNIAARLEQACQPGGILTSHTTWALVKDEIDCEDQGHIDVKGSHKPIRIYRIAPVS
jgi:adenylate cyclase